MKKKVALLVVIALVLLCTFLFYRYQQYILVWRVNPYIKAGGVKLMMAETDVRKILGKEEDHIVGFGGYYLGYGSKGISLTFLNDPDTDFYMKVSKMEITNPEYSAFGIRIGQTYEEAMRLLDRHGIKDKKEGYSGAWKDNLNVVINKDSKGMVRKISIGIYDRISSKRTY